MVAKKREKYRGEAYDCKSGGLKDFVIPIYEKESDNFIGVIFGCQKRPVEKKSGVNKRVYEFVSKEENKVLLPEYKKLRKLYLKVDEADDEEIKRLMVICQDIAKNVSDRFKFYIQQKSQEVDRVQREKAIATIHERLIKAQNLDELWKSMNDNIRDLASWISFDWCIVLRRKQNAHGEWTSDLKVVTFTGRNLPPTLPLIEVAFKQDEIPQIGHVQHGEVVPGLFEEAVRKLVSPQAMSWGFPFHGVANEFVGSLIFGSAPEHRKSTCDPKQIERRKRRIKEVINTVSLKYRWLETLRTLQRREKQLLDAQAYQKGLIVRLEQTLLSLSHQLPRPLMMARGILSYIRDEYNKELKCEDIRDLELGMDIARHGAIFCRGLSSILAAEQGGKLQGGTKRLR